MVQIWVNFGEKSERYRVNMDHARVNTVPDDVPYPIEPTRSVLGRHTIGFHIRPRKWPKSPDYDRAEGAREWSCFAPDNDHRGPM